MAPVSPEAKARALARKRVDYQRNRDKRIAQAVAYKQANAERERELCRARWASNPGLKTRVKTYRASNKQKVAAWEKKYKQANPHVNTAARQRRRARVQNAEGQLSSADWKAIVAEFDGRCAYCQANVRLEQEHMTPLSRGGSHSARNVVPACGPCNRRKGTLTIFEFVAKPPLSERTTTL